MRGLPGPELTSTDEGERKVELSCNGLGRKRLAIVVLLEVLLGVAAAAL